MYVAYGLFQNYNDKLMRNLYLNDNNKRYNHDKELLKIKFST